jgi:hypothetical protein
MPQSGIARAPAQPAPASFKRLLGGSARLLAGERKRRMKEGGYSLPIGNGHSNERKIEPAVWARHHQRGGLSL